MSTGLGRSDARDVTVTADLPAGVTLVSSSPGDRPGHGDRDRPQPPPSRSVAIARRPPGPGEADPRCHDCSARTVSGGRQRRPQADPGLRAGPGDRPSPGRSGRRDRRRPGHASIGGHVRGGHHGRRDQPGRGHPCRRRRADPGARLSRTHGPFAAGIMVSASHNPADDNGLKVLDADGLKLDDADRGGARAAHLARGRARRRWAMPRSGDGSMPARPSMPIATTGSPWRIHRRPAAARPPRWRERLGERARPGDPRRDGRAGRGDPRGT